VVDLSVRGDGHPLHDGRTAECVGVDALHEVRGPLYLGGQHRRLLTDQADQYLVRQPLHDRVEVGQQGDVGPTRRGRGAGAGQAAVGEAPVEGDLQPVAQALLTDVVRGERFEAVNQVGGRDERQQTGVRVGGQVQPVVGVRVDLAQRLVEEL